MRLRAYGTFNKTRDDLEFFLNSNSHADVDQNSVNKTINSFPRNTRIIFFKFLAVRQETIFQEEHSLITLWLFGNGKKKQVVWLMTANNNLISRRWLMCVGSQDDDDDARCVQKAL